MQEVNAVALTPENFQAYGEVLSRSKGDPMADNDEFLYWGKVTELAMTERVSTGFLSCHPRQRHVTSLERHTRTPEIMVALDGDAVVCMAKPESATGSDRIEGIQAFHVRQGQAFVMHIGTWHWAPFPAQEHDSTFLVVFASGTEADDLEIRELPETVAVNF
jgi:ureidoglycolate hydrolase